MWGIGLDLRSADGRLDFEWEQIALKTGQIQVPEPAQEANFCGFHSLDAGVRRRSTCIHI
jgi:hypothetical protein